MREDGSGTHAIRCGVAVFTAPCTLVGFSDVAILGKCGVHSAGIGSVDSRCESFEAAVGESVGLAVDISECEGSR